VFWKVRKARDRIDGRRSCHSAAILLGLANHPDLIRALQQVPINTVSAAARRIWSVSQRGAPRPEKSLRLLCGGRAPLLFSTGYMANLGVMSALLARAIPCSRIV